MPTGDTYHKESLTRVTAGNKMTSGEGAGWAERETSLRLSRAFHV